MAFTPSRRLALEVLLAVEEHGGYATDLLHSSRAHGLSAADRGLATEIVLGVLRWRAQLDYCIDRHLRHAGSSPSPPIRAALRIGVYQLRFLDRIPAMAAVHESVEMAKATQPRAAGFVNAVLRRAAQEARQPIEALLAGDLDPIRRREITASHPAWLFERWSRNFGVEAADAIMAYDNRTPPASIRRAGASADSAMDWSAGLDLAPGRLLRHAWRARAGEVTRTPASRHGQIRIQDEASQLIAYLLEAQPGHRILDTCAAPGGKAELLATLAPQTPLLALELHGGRARRLRRLLAPYASAHVAGADASRPLPLQGRFDRILVDAPCTGTGTLARNPEIRWRLTPGDPRRLAELQLAILRQAAAVLAPRGRLVYSVCSIEPEEGPEVVETLLESTPALHLVAADHVLASLAASGHLATDFPAPPLVACGDFLRILPGAVETDGFFAAILERS